MKKFLKVLSVVLAVAMMLSLAVPAFAAGADTGAASTGNASTGAASTGDASTGGSTTGGSTTGGTSGTDDPVERLPFTDVEKDSYYEDAVKWAYSCGITKGVTATLFGVEKTCTREQAVTFLYRMWKLGGGAEVDSSAENRFVDVKSGTGYYEAILWAANSGITKGVDATHFAPKDEVTRGQIVTFLHRMAGETKVNQALLFTDVPEGKFYTDAVRWGVAGGIVKGISATKFAPNDSCNRAQVVTFLYRAFGDTAK